MSLRFFVIFPVRGLIPASVLLSDALTLVVSYPARAIPVEDTHGAICVTISAVGLKYPQSKR